MVEIEYRQLNSSDIFYRCYIFAQNPEDSREQIYIFMTTNETYKPTQYGNIDMGVRFLAILRPIFEQIYSMSETMVAEVADIQGKIKEILYRAESALQRPEGGQLSTATLVSVLTDLAEAYLRMYEDLENNVPMHKIHNSS